MSSPSTRTAKPDLALVVATYERPEALDALLRVLAEQPAPPFEVVVADDGSGGEIADVVETWRREFGDRLVHAWQPDEGFRLARVLDLGALAASTDYLVFMTHDCLPRTGFLHSIRKAMLPGWFIGGRRIMLSRALTERVLADELPVHRWSLARWLYQRGDVEGLWMLTHRDRRRVGARGLPDFEPTMRAYTLVGVARGDFEQVNGYDTRYVGWGEEDVDLACRLRRLGLRCGHAGPGATLLHLWHESRDVADHPNSWLLDETVESDRVEAVEGLRELALEASRRD